MTSPKTTHYRLFEEKDRPKLVGAINRALARGYEPLGGISHFIGPNSNQHWYNQAMVKHEGWKESLTDDETFKDDIR